MENTENVPDFENLNINSKIITLPYINNKSLGLEYTSSKTILKPIQHKFEYLSINQRRGYIMLRFNSDFNITLLDGSNISLQERLPLLVRRSKATRFSYNFNINI